MQCVPELLLKSAKDSISGLKRPVASVVVEKMTFCCPKLPTWLGGGTWRPIRKRAVTFKVLTLQRNIHIFTIAQIGQSFHFRAQKARSSRSYRENDFLLPHGLFRGGKNWPKYPVFGHFRTFSHATGASKSIWGGFGSYYDIRTPNNVNLMRFWACWRFFAFLGAKLTIFDKKKIRKFFEFFAEQNFWPVPICVLN